MLKLGFSVGATNPHASRTEILSRILELTNEAVEIGFVEVGRIIKGWSEEEIELVKEFKYIELHAPAVEDLPDGSMRLLRYSKSNPEAIRVIDLIQQFRKKVNNDTILFHPDIVVNFDWLNEVFGESLAFENMDNKKQFGKSVEDMEKVFEYSPQAGWVCDVNHIYTIDHSMKLAETFHEKFKSRLRQYHLSAYAGFHSPFVENENEKIIMDGIKEFNVPIIHEGGVTKRELELIEREYKYVKENLVDKSWLLEEQEV